MIDFLVEPEMDQDALRSLVAEALGVRLDETACAPLDSLAYALDLSGCKCLCVYSPAEGDARMLVQLYRYAQTHEWVRERIVYVASGRRVSCYVPGQSTHPWTHVDSEGRVALVTEAEVKEADAYRFRK